MLPTLTFVARQKNARPLIAVGIGGAMLAVTLVGTLMSSAGSTTATGQPQPLVDRRACTTWALALTTSCLSAPMAELRASQSVDLRAVRLGDRPRAVPIPAGLRG